MGYSEDDTSIRKFSSIKSSCGLKLWPPLPVAYLVHEAQTNDTSLLSIALLFRYLITCTMLEIVLSLVAPSHKDSYTKEGLQRFV